MNCATSLCISNFKLNIIKPDLYICIKWLAFPSLNLSCLLCELKCSIKISGSELQGQEEAACACILRTKRPLQ